MTRLGLVLLVALLLAACAAAPRAADPSTPPAAEPKAAGEVDTRCRVDADCVVKDVGNCCGYYPACVNRDSPTFPDEVKARCAAEGTMSICGFPVIEACRCRAGRCEPATGGAELR